MHKSQYVRRNLSVIILNILLNWQKYKMQWENGEYMNSLLINIIIIIWNGIAVFSFLIWIWAVYISLYYNTAIMYKYLNILKVCAGLYAQNKLACSSRTKPPLGYVDTFFIPTICRFRTSFKDKHVHYAFIYVTNSVKMRLHMVKIYFVVYYQCIHSPIYNGG